MEIGGKRDDSLQAASEGVIEEKARLLLDKATQELCRYVNTVAGDTVIANPDNEVRRVMMGLLLAYEEKRNES